MASSLLLEPGWPALVSVNKGNPSGVTTGRTLRGANSRVPVARALTVRAENGPGTVTDRDTTEHGQNKERRAVLGGIAGLGVFHAVDWHSWDLNAPARAEEEGETATPPGTAGTDLASPDTTPVSDPASSNEIPSDVDQRDEGGTGEPEITSRIFLDITVDGAGVGRVVIGLYGKDVPLAASRVEAMARGDRGISLRRKDFVRLTPSYAQNAGLRTFSLTGSKADEARFPGGTTGEGLTLELEQGQRDGRPAFHNTSGAVSLYVFDPALPPPKQRLVAKGGQLIFEEEEVRAPPNGTELTLVFEDAPELDASHVVVGRILEGAETAVAAMRSVPYVQDNSGSPYFRAAKLIGDTRAVVAERGFYRPYKKIVIKTCGVLDG